MDTVQPRSGNDRPHRSPNLFPPAAPKIKWEWSKDFERLVSDHSKFETWMMLNRESFLDWARRYKDARAACEERKNRTRKANCRNGSAKTPRPARSRATFQHSICNTPPKNSYDRWILEYDLTFIVEAPRKYADWLSSTDRTFKRFTRRYFGKLVTLMIRQTGAALEVAESIVSKSLQEMINRSPGMPSLFEKLEIPACAFFRRPSLARGRIAATLAIALKKARHRYNDYLRTTLRTDANERQALIESGRAESYDDKQVELARMEQRAGRTIDPPVEKYLVMGLAMLKNKIGPDNFAELYEFVENDAEFGVGRDENGEIRMIGAVPRKYRRWLSMLVKYISKVVMNGTR